MNRTGGTKSVRPKERQGVRVEDTQVESGARDRREGHYKTCGYTEGVSDGVPR